MNEDPTGHRPIHPFGAATLPAAPALCPGDREAPLPVGTRVVAGRVLEVDAERRPVAWERLVGRVSRVFGVATRGQGDVLHYWYVIEGAGDSWLIPDSHILVNSPPRGTVD